MPLYDYYGCIQLHSHLLARATCILGESGQFPKSAFQKMRTDAATDVVLVPYTLKTLLDYTDKSQSSEDLNTWRQLKFLPSSSDQLSADVLRRTFAVNPDLTVVNVYGLTEVGRACCHVIRSGCEVGNSIGFPTPGMNIWVDAPRGERGEIVISGPTVMLGYLKEVVDQEIKFGSTSEIRTADEGYVGDDGAIHLIGRKDHLLSLHGVKLHPSEIEIAINVLPGVKESLARLQLGEDGDKSVVLDIAVEKTHVDEAQIIETLRRQVPRMFLPSKINFVESIPRTEIGAKVKRPKDSQ